MVDAPTTVIVRLPQALAEHAGGARELTIDVAAPTSLGAILDQVNRVAPAIGRRVQDETGAIRRFVNVYVDADECRTMEGLDTVVRPGTLLYVIPSVAGG
jgi:molybdopterin synthase sulfur carrier subunit